MQHEPEPLPPIIKVENIYRTFVLGDVEVEALRGVSLTIQPGEFVAIMGSSGSGKSTLMNILGCLDRPTSGHYFLPPPSSPAGNNSGWQLASSDQLTEPSAG